MNTKSYTATAEIDIDKDKMEVWDALLNPKKVKKYFFGTNVRSDYQRGSDIFWEGEWEGKKYQDKGKIVNIDPGKLLEYTHYSPMTGEPDIPENYHTVSITLSEKSGKTHVQLTQDKNPTLEASKHSEENWKMILEGLKKVVENEE